MNFLRKLASMLRKDIYTPLELDFTGSNDISFLSESRVTGDSLVSDLLPVFADARASDKDEV